jgi:hypothetical protein
MYQYRWKLEVNGGLCEGCIQSAISSRNCTSLLKMTLDGGPDQNVKSPCMAKQFHCFAEAIFVDGYIKMPSPKHPIKDRIVKNDEK